MNRLIFIAVLAVAAAFSSCKKDDRIFTVTFESNGGSAVEAISVKEGEKLTKPSLDPTKDGYAFAAWCKEAALTSEWEFDADEVTANMMLYAKWMKVKLVETATGYNGDIKKFEYDDQNRFTKCSFYNRGVATPYQIYTFTYSGDDLVQLKLDYVSHHSESTDEYAKNGNQITVTQTWRSSPNVFIYTLDLNSDGTLDKVTYSEDNWSEETAYQYQDGNVTKASYKYIVDGIITDTNFNDYTYDSKNSPWLHCKTPKWLLIWFWGYDGYGSKNNMTASPWEDSNGNGGKAEFAYLYDDDGYPTQRTWKSYDKNGDKVGEWVAEYTYK